MATSTATGTAITKPTATLTVTATDPADTDALIEEVVGLLIAQRDKGRDVHLTITRD